MQLTLDGRTGPRIGRYRTADQSRGPMRGVRLCAWCGKPFEWHPKLRTTYCSTSCRSLMRNEGKSCPVPWITCACGKRFIKHGPRTYCSPECRPSSRGYSGYSEDQRARHREAARRRRHGQHPPSPLVEGACEECGQPFRSFKWRQKKYCTRRCAARAHKRDRKHKIRAGRQGAEFITIRTVGNRDGWHCHICHRKVQRKDASIDHLNPLSLGGTHTLDNVALAHHRCNTLRGAGKTHAQLRLIA